MKVAIVYDPDPELGSDPLDEAKKPYRLGEFLDSDKLDIFIAYREVGEEFVEGARTIFIGSGIWENLSEEQNEQIHAWLNEGLP